MKIYSPYSGKQIKKMDTILEAIKQWFKDAGKAVLASLVAWTIFWLILLAIVDY